MRTMWSNVMIRHAFFIILRTTVRAREEEADGPGGGGGGGGGKALAVRCFALFALFSLTDSQSSLQHRSVKHA